MAIASISPKFNRLPTPKYKRSAKIVSEMDTTSPLLELAKISEAVKSMAVKNVTKNRGITPNICGLTK